MTTEILLMYQPLCDMQNMKSK